MNNQGPIIVAENLHKIYRLYTKPKYRLLDALGLLPQKSHYYAEHAAIKNLNLQINFGEKVALIGRNGAGKSTLLKLISGIMKPTAGTLNIQGQARALLQIGTGFHPDFTGRDNVKAYLAQMGLMGSAVNALMEEIIDFAELEEYIDQPLKTYSTGMSARLMFATSTATVPDLLILDEILSVGDAYFTQKSMDRISEMCSSRHSTLLLVSHDVYGAAKLVDRMIWIDKGEIISDASPQITLKAYEDSIRAQEEQRLRKKQFTQLTRYFNQEERLKSSDNFLMIEIAAMDNIPQPDRVHFAEIALIEDDKIIASVPLFSGGSSEAAGLIESPCWGTADSWEGEPCLPMLNYGSPNHKVAVFFQVPHLQQKLQEKKLTLRLKYGSNQALHLTANIFTQDKLINALTLPSELQQWISHDVLLEEQGSHLPLSLNRSGCYGSGAIHILGMELCNESGDKTNIIEHEKPAVFKIDYEIKNPHLKEKLNIILTFYKNGVETSCRFFTDSLLFDAEKCASGQIEVMLDKILLGAGDYSVSILVAKEGYVNQSHFRFYTLNPDMYFSIREALAFKVVGGNVVAQGTPYVGESQWQFALARE